MRRRIEILAWTLIWSGLLIGGYVAWQLFVTDWMTGRVQTAAQPELQQAVEDADPPSEEFDVSDLLEGDRPLGLPDTVRLVTEPSVGHGEAMAFIRIPRIGVDEVVFSGVDRATLNKGPGHMERTPVPGQPGNSVISGHRTTYGKPFFDLDALEAGDRIEVETRTGVHVYQVMESMVVKPTDVWVTDDRPGGWLTLITCHPRFSARERLVVVAELVAGPNLDYIRIGEMRGAA